MNEFWFIETKDGNKYWGFLFDCNEIDYCFANCKKLDPNTNYWIPYGKTSEQTINEMTFSRSEIKRMEQAPYNMKDYKDYGLGPPFTDKK